MAYSIDLVVEITQYHYNGNLVKTKGINGSIVSSTIELFRVTFKAKNMSVAINLVDNYRKDPNFKLDISIAMSEHGINSNDVDYYSLRVWSEKTPR